MAKLDIAALAARLGELNKPRNTGGSSMSFIDIKDGVNNIRIMPPKDDDCSFYVETWVHYQVGKSETNKKGTMIVCPKTKDENAYCPVCELSSQYKKLSSKKGDTYDTEARQIYRKKRVYYNAINRDEDLSVYEQREVEEGKPLKWFNKDSGEEESPVKVLATGIEVFKGILGYIVDPEYGDITDEASGLDIKITKTGSGQFNTNYDVKTARKESAIGFAKWADSMHDLNALAVTKSQADIEAIMSGQAVASSNNAIVDKNAPDDGKAVDISDPVTSADEASEDDAEAAIKAALARRRAAQNK